MGDVNNDAEPLLSRAVHEDRDFPFLERSLDLVHRFYQDLNREMSATTAKAGLTLAAVIAFSTTGLVHLEPDALWLFGNMWFAAAATMVVGLSLLLGSAIVFFSSFVGASVSAPYDAASLIEQREALYQDRIRFYVRQLDSHEVAINEMLARNSTRQAQFRRGVNMAVVGAALILAVQLVAWILEIGVRYGQ